MTGKTWWAGLLLAFWAAGCGGGGGGGGSSNARPAATSLVVGAQDGGSSQITLAGTDADGDALSFRIVQSCTHGTLSGTPPVVTYVPDPGFHGTDSFTYVADDGKEASEPAVVTLSVAPAEALPLAQGQTASTAEDTPVDVTLAGTSPQERALTFQVATAPANGSLSGTAPHLTYTPATHFHGADGFTFTVNDGVHTSAPASVALTVTAVNHAPTAQAQTVSTAEDTPLVVTLAGQDPDGDALTYTVRDAPAHGSLTGTPPRLTYTPSADFFGTDRFTFAASDGIAESAPAVVDITVTPVNDPPAVTSATVSGVSGGKATLRFQLADAEGDVCSVLVEYRGGAAGAAWKTATVEGAMAGLAPGAALSLVWNAPADEPDQSASDYQLRLTPSDGKAAGAPYTTATFSVKTAFFRRYVDAAAPAGGDGLSWGTAVRHPQDALDAASDGDQVWVARGTYALRNPGTDASVIVMKQGVALYGGFSGTEGSPEERVLASNASTLDGGGTAKHVVLGANEARLDGFTVTGGNAQGQGEDQNGGGMYNLGTSPLVVNCVFSGNTAYSMGGGMYISESSPTVIGCRFEHNTSTRSGAGMDVAHGSSPNVRECAFAGNQAGVYGGGMEIWDQSSPTIERCSFSGNQAQGGGGLKISDGASPVVLSCSFTENSAKMGAGAYSNGAGSPAFTDCTFSGNGATNYGGGMLNGNGVTATVSGCTFRNNSALEAGGGMFNYAASPAVSDCTFIANASPTGWGGGIYSGETSSPAVSRCRFLGNVAGKGGGVYNVTGSAPTFSNCVIAGNQAAAGGGAVHNCINAAPKLINCTITGNRASGTGSGGIYNVDGCTPTVTNSIVWANGWSNEQIDDAIECPSQALSNTTVLHSVVGWLPLGQDTAYGDPHFVTPGYWSDSGTPSDTSDDLWADGDYSLRPGSPCIDAADGTAAPSSDIDGKPRYDDPAISNRGVGAPDFADIGAYEYQGTGVGAGP